MKIFPREKILQDDKLLFAKWKTNTVSSREFVLMQENAFVFVVKGKKLLYQGEQIIKVGTQQLLVLKKGIHCMTEYLAEDGTFEAIVIYFGNAFIEHLRLVDQLGEDQAHYSNQEVLLLDRNKIIDSFINQYCSYIEESTNDRNILKLKVEELIYLLLNKHPHSKYFFHAILNQPNDLRILMERLYRENYTMDKLAQISNRSLSAFKRDFGRVFQSSPAKWILSRRLSDACVLLVNSDKSMSEIAFESGFETLSQFDKAFKRFFKTTPSAFRASPAELNRQNIGPF